jgi:hypothetical protein
MNNKRIQLAARRAELMNRASAQREELSQAFEHLRAPLTLADKGMSALRFIAQHPLILAGALALAVAVKPKRWLFVLENGWLAWRIAKAAKRRLESPATQNRIQID